MSTKIKKNIKDGVFPTGTDQIDAASSILQQKNTSLQDVSTGLLSSLATTSSTFFTEYSSLLSTDKDEASEFRKTFFLYKIMSISTFLLIVFLISRFNASSFIRLRRAVNSSTSSIDEGARLTRQGITSFSTTNPSGSLKNKDTEG